MGKANWLNYYKYCLEMYGLKKKSIDLQRRWKGNPWPYLKEDRDYNNLTDKIKYFLR